MFYLFKLSLSFCFIVSWSAIRNTPRPKQVSPRTPWPWFGHRQHSTNWKSRYWTCTKSVKIKEQQKKKKITDIAIVGDCRYVFRSFPWLILCERNWFAISLARWTAFVHQYSTTDTMQTLLRVFVGSYVKGINNNNNACIQFTIINLLRCTVNGTVWIEFFCFCSIILAHSVTECAAHDVWIVTLHDHEFDSSSIVWDWDRLSLEKIESMRIAYWTGNVSPMPFNFDHSFSFCTSIANCTVCWWFLSCVV